MPACRPQPCALSRRSVLLYAIGLIGAVSHSSALLLKHLEHCVDQLAVTSSEMDADRERLGARYKSCTEKIEL